jgi:preprotein translocase subunit SecD
MRSQIPVNAFPKWKYYFLLVLLTIATLYAVPNLFGEDPAVQVVGLKGYHVEATLQQQVEKLLADHHLPIKSISLEKEELLIRFNQAETQLKAKEMIRNSLKEPVSVALNLAPATPDWLVAIGARPMKLGLDLRGGVHFLMQVDVASMMSRRMANDANPAREPSEAELQAIRTETLDQTVAILRNRINELGVSEAVVQRQGLNRVIVELPGIQDTAYARDILGKTATLKFVLEDHEHNIKDVLMGHPVRGSKIHHDRFQRPVLLKTQPIVTGEMIVSASTSQDREGQPAVSIRLGGNVALFSKITRENIGRRMAVIYVESNHGVNSESVISLATIQSALGNQFQITGLHYEEARDLALLLRAGALPAPVSIVEESIVGPSLGQENIRMGVISVAVGLGLVLFGMAAYYSVFGLIANLALVANLILLLAAMSLIGATLTLPGIAGIVLTLGMAVDANVLIFERIREELRLGLSPRTSIHRGFQYAFGTIVDSNLTTLIVGIVLFAIGTGPVKGFAVTLSIGILTSLLTATMGTRSLVELLYGAKTVIKRVRVGI